MSAAEYAHRYQVLTPYGVDLVVSESLHHELGALVFMQAGETVCVYAPSHWLRVTEEDSTRTPGLWDAVRRSIARREGISVADTDRPDDGA